ncbi:MAG: tetratricopeptide repeat protein [Endomicrobiales bacterium]
MRSIFREFWILLLLAYVVLGVNIIKAEGTNLNRAMQMVNEGRTEEAISLLRQEIEKNPETGDVHLALGVAYLDKDDFDAARVSLEKARDLSPNSVPVHYSLAMLYEKERRLELAVSEWKTVYQLTDSRELKELADKHIRQLEGAR